MRRRDVVEERDRMGGDRMKDSGGRLAELRVPRLERIAPVGRVMRNHEQEVEERDRNTRSENHGSGKPFRVPDRVPKSEASDRGTDLLLRRDRESREDGERDKPLFVEIPDRELDERDRDGN